MATSAGVVAIAAGLALGCAAHRTVLDPMNAVGGRCAYRFWPPAPSSATWSTASDVATFGDAARRVARALHDAGDDEVRWYPIGTGFRHGFAVTTRLEALRDDGSPKDERWSSLYREPANLIWLESAREPQLPAPGRYRALLLAFTRSLRVPPNDPHPSATFNVTLLADALSCAPTAYRTARSPS